MGTPLRQRRGPRHHVVIVGANFAGLTAGQHLPARHAVTVIDSSSWFEWLPNIHELLSGAKRPETLRLSRRRLIAATGHRFVCAAVDVIDPGAGRVILANGRSVPFDICIVAVGGVNETFGVTGAGQYAMPFKSVAQCDAIGRRLATLARRPGPVDLVIVGGGLEGVEALGEILRRYREHPGLAVRVVEGSRALLPGAPKALDALVRRHCAPFNVRFDTGTRVTKVTKTRVYLNSGDVAASDLTIWTGGATASPVLLASGLASRPKQWAPVRQTLQSRHFDNVFVVGDAAALPKPLSKQAYYAMQMGKHAADNVERLLEGQPLRPFTPSAKPVLIAFGDLDAFLVSGTTVLAGTVLTAAKEAVFELTMAQIDPPTTRQALAGLARRLVQCGIGIALPTLTSPRALRRLPQVRLIPALAR